MTAYRFVTLTCDICGEIHDDGISMRVREARKTAAREGWRTVRTQEGKFLDKCPRHP
jgi:hypothetical protein